MDFKASGGCQHEALKRGEDPRTIGNLSHCIHGDRLAELYSKSVTEGAPSPGLGVGSEPPAPNMTIPEWRHRLAERQDETSDLPFTGEATALSSNHFFTATESNFGCFE